MNYDRLILELMNRVSILEEEIQVLKNNQNKGVSERNTEENQHSVSQNSGRDKTKYMLGGKKHAKNRLVLAVVKKYMEENPNISAEKLISVFDRSLQGSLGVVRKLDEVKEVYSDYKKRFFTNDDEIINTSTGDCVVCTQWGIGNIIRLVKKAEELGIEILTIS